MTVEAFIIHLKRAEKRAPQVESLQARLPLKTHVIDAVDGLLLDQDTVRSVYARHLHRPRYPFELRPAEIGCFLSHRTAWRRIVDGGLDAGLIVEDDVDFDPAFPPALQSAITLMQPIDYVRFPYRSHTDKGPEVGADAHVSLHEPRLPGVGMQMQLVGRQAAQALLEATERFDRPVDTLIQLRSIPGMRILAARPICIRQIGEQLGGSVVQKKKKPLAESLSREIKRAAYRLALRSPARGKRQ
jgi:GR25 family glycosyltransferase involved in LPS biosynthesis